MTEEIKTEEKKTKGRKNIYIGISFVICYLFMYALVLVSQPLYEVLSKAVEALNLMIPIFSFLQFFVDILLPLAAWESPMFFLLPLTGFFFMYLLTDWAYDYFELEKVGPKWFTFVFWVTAVLSYLVVLLWYYTNAFSLAIEGNPQLKQAGVTFFVYLFGGQLPDGSPFGGIGFNFWEYWKSSAFLVFCLGAYLGWLSQRYFVPLLEKNLG
jgi:hypothetical protein